jgi:N6-L-threonylcarbamoyladenine synthase
MILSIESSCDDSAIAITEIATKKVIFHQKISQESEHSIYGGVVPELASRLHAVALPQILEHTKVYFPKLKAIAVTNEPGLGVTLMEGIAMAKTLSFALQIPLISVHHLKAHIYSLFIEKEVILPIVVLLVSGGHTQIIRVKSFDDMEILATTMDDSVGESFDKCAKMMGLGYPGGAIIESLATQGDSSKYILPVPLSNSPLIAFSLSGLKNAVRLLIESLGGVDINYQDKCDVAASFQHTVLLHLLQKSKKLLAKEPIKNVAIVGGVAANQYIKNGYEKLCNSLGKKLHTVELQYCSDNAAMVGRYSIELYNNKIFTNPNNLQANTTQKHKNGTKL